MPQPGRASQSTHPRIPMTIQPPHSRTHVHTARKQGKRIGRGQQQEARRRSSCDRLRSTSINPTRSSSSSAQSMPPRLRSAARKKEEVKAEGKGQSPAASSSSFSSSLLGYVLGFWAAAKKGLCCPPPSGRKRWNRLDPHPCSCLHTCPPSYVYIPRRAAALYRANEPLGWQVLPWLLVAVDLLLSIVIVKRVPCECHEAVRLLGFGGGGGDAVCFSS
jgi:hypothetical protein